MELAVTSELWGSNLDKFSLSPQNVQVVAVKYVQNLATQQGEEHEEQDPKYTAT